jgi:hypothetical protein
MTTKEKLKKRIDLLPEELLDQVQQYLDNIKTNKRSKQNIETIHLKGQYDNLDIRQQAYESYSSFLNKLKIFYTQKIPCHREH